MLGLCDSPQDAAPGAAVPQTSRQENVSEAAQQRYNVRSQYEFIRTLGKGTYGKVKLAVEKNTGKQFAVKTIRKDRIKDKKDMQHILREIKIMSSLRHPNIIQIHEVFENQDKIVIVMEYAPKGELYDYLADKKITSEAESRVFFKQIVLAVQYSHKLGVVHRDLKLENILLGENYQIKIADFGLANMFTSDQLLHTFCGSPLYASPEIVNGVPYRGPEVDSWSLGVLLYALVYGMMPFDGSDYKTLTWQISHGEYARQTKHLDAGDLIGKMLTVDPRARANINQIANHHWLQEQPLDAISNYLTPSMDIYPPTVTSQQLPSFSPVVNGYIRHPMPLNPAVLNGYVAPATSPNPRAGFVPQPVAPSSQIGNLASEQLNRTVLTPCALENCENSNCPLTQRKGILKRIGQVAVNSLNRNPAPSNLSPLRPMWTHYASPVQQHCSKSDMLVKDACGLQAKDSLKLKAKPPGASGKRRHLRSKKDRESGYYSSPERTPVEVHPAQPSGLVFNFSQPVIKPQLTANMTPENLKPRHIQPQTDAVLPNQFGVPFAYVVPMANVNQTMPIIEGQAMSYFPQAPITIRSSVDPNTSLLPYTVTTLNREESQTRRTRPISTYSDSSILSSDSFELCIFESPLSTAAMLSTVGLTQANTVINPTQAASHAVLSPAVRPETLSLPITPPPPAVDGRCSPDAAGALTPKSAKLNRDLSRILAPNGPRRRKAEDQLRDSRPPELAEEQANELDEMMRQLNLDLERACTNGLDDMKVSLTASTEV